MRSKSYLLKIFLLMACYGFLTSGCRKLYDYIQTHGDGDYKACNIKKLQVLYYPPFAGAKTDTFNFQFTYNALGNPVSVINDHVGTGNGNFFFKYDKYNRLREFTSLYTNGYETWHRYGCNDKGQVVRDTMHIFGALVNGAPVPSDFYYYFDFAYDSKNRISTETVASYIRENLSFIDKKVYTYDAKGNLVTNGVNVYDDKLSIYRTNSIWMFILRDYSVNNRFIATKYNEFGLPLVFNSKLNLIGGPGTDTRVEYFCH